jgi:hypothetical protein
MIMPSANGKFMKVFDNQYAESKLNKFTQCVGKNQPVVSYLDDYLAILDNILSINPSFSNSLMINQSEHLGYCVL